MSEPILGVDIAKKKYDVALLFVNGKLKHKVFKNNQEGFGELSLWLKRQEVDQSTCVWKHRARMGMNWLPTSMIKDTL